jgi:hypothetical protein
MVLQVSGSQNGGQVMLKYLPCERLQLPDMHV